MKSLVEQFENLFSESPRRISKVVLNHHVLDLIKIVLADQIRLGHYRGAYLSGSKELPVNAFHVTSDFGRDPN